MQIFFSKTRTLLHVEIVQIGTAYLLYDSLGNGRVIFQVGRGGNAGKGFKIPYKMRLVKVAAFICDRSERLIIPGDQLKAVLEPVYFIK